MDTGEVIREVPFFRSLRDEDVAQLSQICRVKGALAGTKLFAQGDPSDSFYIMVAGRVDIRVIDQSGHTKVFSMRQGDFFGEMGVIRNSPRSGTAFVAEDAVFLEIMKYDFDRLMAVNKFFSGMVMDAFLQRTQTTLAARTSGAAQASGRPVATGPEAGQRKATMITLFSPIGGAGTSALAANIAAKIRDFTKKRVLLIDACFQFGVLGTVLGAKVTRNIADLVTTDIAIRPHDIEAYAVKTSCGVELLPAPRNPEDAPRFKAPQVAQILEGAAQVWDWIVVDTANVMEEPNLTILDHSDQIWMVLVPEVTAIRRLLAWLALMQKLGYSPDRIQIILNKVQDDDQGGTITPELIAQKLNRKLLGVIPWDLENMGRSINTGCLVVEGNPLCDVSVQIANMVRESLFPPEEEEKQRKGFLYKLFGGS